MNIDLIYVEYTNGRTMSVAIAGCAEEGMLGPVPGKYAISTLAPMLRERLANANMTLKQAEDALTMIHMRNMLAGVNSAGQSYPYKIDAPN